MAAEQADKAIMAELLVTTQAVEVAELDLREDHRLLVIIGEDLEDQVRLILELLTLAEVAEVDTMEIKGSEAQAVAEREMAVEDLVAKHRAMLQTLVQVEDLVVLKVEQQITAEMVIEEY
jgi:hypothetical protein